MKETSIPYSFCRTAFCEACAKKGRPWKRDDFITFPKHFILEDPVPLPRIHQGPAIPNKNIQGFTPHLFLLVEINTYPATEEEPYPEVTSLGFNVLCLMNHCGIELKESTEFAGQFGQYEIIGDCRKITIDIEDALALLHFTDNGYEMEYHG